MSELTELALRRLLSNIGYVDKKHTIIRSGQPKTLLKFKTFYKLFPFKTVINLAWSPGTDDDDRDEYRFCIDKGIDYHKLTWGAAVPMTEKYADFWNRVFPETVELIDTCKKPVWIHCEGGRDRTGGLVAAWKLKHGYLLDDIFSDFCKYGMPANCWLQNLWERMNKNSRIYVAGHTGLVGSALLLKLQEQGYNNYVVRKHNHLDLTNWYDVGAFFSYNIPEYVFLCAAKVGGIYANNTYPAEFISKNLMIQNNIIKACHEFKVKKLLFLGSSCIYPRDCQQPMKEDYLLSGKLEPTNEAYAIAKIAGIKMCQAYNKQYGTNYISVMPTNLYGPRDNFDVQNGHVIGSLIAKFATAKKEGKPVTILGNGSAKREFLYSEDLAEALIFLMNNYDSSEIINIGCDEYVYVEELVWLLCELFEYDNIKWDNFSPNGTPEKKLDTSKLESLGWKYKTTLREGLEKTIKWYYETRTL